MADLSKKLLKVTFEYEDRTEVLEGDVVQKWLDAVNAPIGVMIARGYPNMALEEANKHWKVTWKKDMQT